MPFADVAEWPSNQALQCDVCIVGSGPAGATIAQELSETGLRVIVLESGGWTRQGDADELNDVENIGRPRVADQWLVRNRIVGGSSHTWSGRCAPFDEIDFEPREWVPYSGWPFALDEVTPFLGRAARHLGLGSGAALSADRFWKLVGRSPPQPALDTQNLLPFFWQFSRNGRRSSQYMRFGPRLVKRIGPRVTLLTNATVQQIVVNAEASKVTAIEVAAADGARRVVSAPVVVVCAGAIENARLLLSSNRVMATGLGNGHDLVGRFLMDHPRGAAASFDLVDCDGLRRRFGQYFVKDPDGGHVYAHGLRLSPRAQRAEGLLNCAAWLDGDISADDPWDAVKRMLRLQPRLADDVFILASNVPLLCSGLKQHLVERNGLPRKIDRLKLVVMVEQRPDPDSRVTLSDRRDRFGMPRCRIDWRINEQEQHTARRMAQMVAADFARAGLQSPTLEPWVAQGAPFPDTFQDVAHPTGTTRMGHDPRTSVVDADCQVHGIQGLYIAGSSVFPTSGHANPTQMIVALAIRLADTIKVRHGFDGTARRSSGEAVAALASDSLVALTPGS
jgi:choline dehydrogenase-like flavoprotein